MSLLTLVAALVIPSWPAQAELPASILPTANPLPSPPNKLHCQDIDPGCQDYIKAGDTCKPASWLHEYCAKSCGTCTMWKRPGLAVGHGDVLVSPLLRDGKPTIAQRCITGRAVVLAPGVGTYDGRLSAREWEELHLQMDFWGLACDELTIEHSDIIFLVAPWNIELQLCLVASMRSRRSRPGRIRPLLVLGNNGGSTVQLYEQVVQGAINYALQTGINTTGWTPPRVVEVMQAGPSEAAWQRSSCSLEASLRHIEQNSEQLQGVCGGQATGLILEVLRRLDYRHAHIFAADWQENVQWRSIATFVTLNGLGVTALFLDGEFQEPERHAPGSAKQFVQDISKDNLRPTSAATKPTEAISSSSVSQLLCVLKTERGEQCDEHAEETRLETDAELYKRNVAAELVRESETEGCGQHCDMPTLTLEHNPTLFDQEGRIALHAQWVRSRKSSALLIGCGPSVNLLSKEQYEKLREHADVWTINQVFFHPFIQPDYAHVELHSKEQVPVWKENLGQKWPKE